MKLLEIAVDVPINKTFTYLPLENTNPNDLIGKRVKVPFGKKILTGYVLPSRLDEECRAGDLSRSVPQSADIGNKDINSASQISLFNETPSRKLKRILEVIDDQPIINSETIRLAQYISQNYICSIGEALSCAASCSMQKPKRQQKREREERKEKRENTATQNTGAPSFLYSPVLTPHQQFAFDKISSAISSNENKNFLLHGVTASGKTEVYIRSIEYALKRGKDAIMLIPEISLAAQFSDIVLQRFGSSAGLWHSHISNIEKYKLFYNALNGQIKVMLGARSAVFAPFKNLGLIIIDEEHEHTYKQEQKPSYDVREIAFWRAKENKACVILGSATPSLETYSRAVASPIESERMERSSSQSANGDPLSTISLSGGGNNGSLISPMGEEKRGKIDTRGEGITLIRLPERIDNKKLPEIKVISLKDKPRFGGLLLSETVAALSKTLANKEQAIVFLNRRGHSPSIMCKKCLVVYQCPNCSISMAYHKYNNLLKCHYCGFTQKLPIVCPECKSKEFNIFGIGTQKVEDELKKTFPKARIFRLDSDTASQKGIYEKAYRGLKNGEYDILLGTQMIAKGFDFEKMSLVCVINADTSLYLPDFRSAEKTFQLITQAAGRCGRAKVEGRVIIQTAHPNHYAIQYAQNYDFEGFYKAEMKQRQDLFYPPYCEIAKITIKNKNEDKVEKESQNLLDFIKVCNDGDKSDTKNKKALEKSMQILGISTPYIAKISNVFRRYIILKGSKTALLETANTISEYQNAYWESQISIEMMPSELV
ncbi:MAG: primosomal protein N' [Elusimicrobiota bacterium]|jgi:primosomal protein N' (replication factor Y)|nr:primosomal protein N' [Elusimicrobiota bacterium]